MADVEWGVARHALKMHSRWFLLFLLQKQKNQLEKQKKKEKEKNPYCLNVNRIMVVAMITEYINKHPVVLMRLRLRL